MTNLEHLFKLLLIRKFESAIPIRAHPIVLLGIPTLLLGGLCYVWLGSLFSLLAPLETSLKLRLGYLLGVFIAILPITFSLIRSLSLRTLANESIAALPIPQLAWAQLATKYHYRSQSPILLALVGSAIANLFTRTSLPISHAIALSVCVAITSLCMLLAATKCTILVLLDQRASKATAVTVGYIMLSGVALFTGYRLLIPNIHSRSLSLHDAIASIGILIVYTGIYTLLRRHSHNYRNTSLALPEESVAVINTARHRAVGAPVSLLRIVLTVVVRDKKFWVVTSINVVLTLFIWGICLVSQSSNTATYFASFLPILLILGQATIAAEIRGQLGNSRESVYTLPMTKKYVISTVQVISAMIIGGPLLLLVPPTQLILTHHIDISTIIRIMLTCGLAAQVACLTSILSFESRRDVARGLATGLLLFLLLWPLLALDSWLQSKSLTVTMFSTFVIATLLHCSIVFTEKYMHEKEG